MIRNNIVGGPSLVFHRHHEVGKTSIGNSDNVTQKVVGYDANSLYLYATQQDMPSGLYCTWDHKNPDNIGDSVRTTIEPGECEIEGRTSFSNVVTNNMDRVMIRKRGTRVAAKEMWFIENVGEDLKKRFNVSSIHIQHQFNGGQKQVFDGSTRYFLDGFIPANTYGNHKAIAIEFDGCKWHCPHRCSLNQNVAEESYIQRNNATRKKHEFLRSQDFELFIMEECSITNWGVAFQSSLYNRSREKKASALLNEILEEQLFGLVECDIQVPWYSAALRNYWSEFPSIFKNIAYRGGNG